MTSASPGADRPTATPLSGGRPNPHYSIERSSLIGAEARDELAHDLADQPRLVFIGLGGIALPFIHFPFSHGGHYGD